MMQCNQEKKEQKQVTKLFKNGTLLGFQIHMSLKVRKQDIMYVHLLFIKKY